jgi:hypothetical protein
MGKILATIHGILPPLERATTRLAREEEEGNRKICIKRTNKHRRCLLVRAHWLSVNFKESEAKPTWAMRRKRRGMVAGEKIVTTMMRRSWETTVLTTPVI